MANQPPDPRTLNSWEDAFQYPLPVVRKLEQQLRKNIDENRQKLRSLVGASYRDLLGTAERIIDMDGLMQGVESHLGDIGRKCNARAVERASENHAEMVKTRDGREKERCGVMAQTKLLQSALSVASRTIKAGGDALVVAKQLVLARLLCKSVEESGEAPGVLEELRRKLGLLRKKLLGYIERALVRTGVERTALASTLCAYALVSSSAPKDVLRHFLQARFEQLEARSEAAAEADVLQMLDMYKQTLLDTRALFPRLFAEALSQLSNVPLLQDKQLSALYELNLDVYGMWIAEDVRSFTPWVRHEQLLSSDVGEALASWAKQAQQTVLDAVKKCISRENEVRVVLDTRKKVLSQYLSLSGSLRDGSHGDTIRDLNHAFTSKLEELTTQCAHSLWEVRGVMEGEGPSSAPGSGLDLWELASGDQDLAGGAMRFRRSVLDERHGRDDTIQACVDKLDEWTGNLDALWELTQQMRSTRWNDELDIDFDDLDDGDSIQESLSRTDPERLQTVFRQALSEALQQLYEVVEQMSASEERAAFLLRLSRDIDRRRVHICNVFGVNVESLSNLDMMRTLHHHIAEATAEGPLQQYTAATRKRTFTAVALWDGSPALPVQPSPATIRFLVSLHKSMSGSGTDLWSPIAVDTLRAHMSERLADMLDSTMLAGGREGSPLTNGHAVDGEDVPNGVDEEATVQTESRNESRRRESLQSLFDALYLQRVLSSGPSTARVTNLQELIAAFKERSELDGAAHDRLQRSANEYWKRTYLLFGLLAPSAG